MLRSLKEFQNNSELFQRSISVLFHASYDASVNTKDHGIILNDIGYK